MVKYSYMTKLMFILSETPGSQDLLEYNYFAFRGFNLLVSRHFPLLVDIRIFKITRN